MPLSTLSSKDDETAMNCTDKKLRLRPRDRTKLWSSRKYVVGDKSEAPKAVSIYNASAIAGRYDRTTNAIREGDTNAKSPEQEADTMT